MHGRRTLAACAAAGLLISLFAPWYRETVVARGLSGPRTLTLTRSGWQAFSSTELLIAVVAVLTLLVVIGIPPDEPGNAASDRSRLSGALVAVLGAIAFVVLLIRLMTAPGTTANGFDHTTVAVRWGILLALAFGAVLAAAGLRLIRASRPVTEPGRAAGRERRRRATGSESPVQRAESGASNRERGSKRPPRGRPSGTTSRAAQSRAAQSRAAQSRPARADRAQSQAPGPDRARARLPAPRTDDREPSETPGARRPERTRPSRRSDTSRWEEQATSWLDLPE
jgi:hypothetical protein